MPSWKAEWPRSLMFRLLLSYLVAWVLTLAVVGGALWLWLSAPTGDAAPHSSQRAAYLLSKALVFDANGQPVGLALEDGLKWLPEALPQDFSYRVTDPSGRVLLASPAVAPAQGQEPPLLRTHTVRRDHGGHTWHTTVGISERLVALIHLGASQRIGGAALATVLVSVLLLGLVLLLTVQRLLRPLREASLQATQIHPRQLSHRLSEQDLPDELQPLVHAFNRALDRLEAGFRNQQRFLADAAHELKTPLALLRGQIEMGGEGHTEQLLNDVDHLARQVQQLLVLAEVSEAGNFKPETTHLLPLAQEVLAFMRPLAAQRRVLLDLGFEDARTMIHCDRMALFVLLKNLLENALNFAPERSAVTLALRAQSLTVRDAGPGIHPDHLPHLFKRFWRGPERRHDGAGLGLAICQEIAMSHGWTLTVRSDQTGTDFVLHFGAV